MTTIKTKTAAPSDSAALPECIEGQEAFTRFDETVKTLLAVPHSTLVRRERAYRKKVDANPNRRGPKRKSRLTSASRASGAKD